MALQLTEVFAVVVLLQFDSCI